MDLFIDFSTLKFCLEKLFCGVFSRVKLVKKPQFNFSSQNLSIERNFFKWDGKENKILHLLFHRIWKIIFLLSFEQLWSEIPFLNFNPPSYFFMYIFRTMTQGWMDYVVKRSKGMYDICSDSQHRRWCDLHKNLIFFL